MNFKAAAVFLAATNSVLALDTSELNEHEKKYLDMWDRDTKEFHEAMANSEDMESFVAQTAIHRLMSQGQVDRQNHNNQEPQLIYLDFEPAKPHYTVNVFQPTPNWVEPLPKVVPCGAINATRVGYTEDEKVAIHDRLTRDFDPFGVEFIHERIHPLDGTYSTLKFFYESTTKTNKEMKMLVADCEKVIDQTTGKLTYTLLASELENILAYPSMLGGVADGIDFLNTNRADNAVLDGQDWVNFMLGLNPDQLQQKLKLPMTEGETLEEYRSRLIINGAANIGAHEIGHILGLRHRDSADKFSTEIADRDAWRASLEYSETNVMASPAFWKDANVLTTVYSENSIFSERSALKLAMSLHGELISEAEAKAADEPLKLSTMEVPNPAHAHNPAENPHLFYDALAFYGSISEKYQTDVYSFDLEEGTSVQLEIMSTTDRKISDFINAEVLLFFVEEDGSLTFVAGNGNEFESMDSLLFRPIQKTGTYQVHVRASRIPVALEMQMPWLEKFNTGDYIGYIFAIPDAKFHLTYQPDTWPHETTATLSVVGGSEVAKIDAPEGAVRENVALSDGVKYQLCIEDSYGDGMNNNTPDDTSDDGKIFVHMEGASFTGNLAEILGAEFSDNKKCVCFTTEPGSEEVCDSTAPPQGMQRNLRGSKGKAGKNKR